jgi:HK97 gp10 family phage protein
MAFEITVDTSGLRRLADSLEPDITRILDEVAAFIKERAQQLAPVLTGALRESIDVVVQGWAILASVSVDYAQFVEYGTSKMAAHPFMTPAIEEGARMLSDKLERLFDV